MVSHRGTYSASTLATDESRRLEVDEPYQEPTPDSITNFIPIDGFTVDYGELPHIEPNIDFDNDEDGDSDEDEDGSDDEDDDDNAGYEDPDEDEGDDDANGEEDHDNGDDEWLDEYD